MSKDVYYSSAQSYGYYRGESHRPLFSLSKIASNKTAYGKIKKYEILRYLLFEKEILPVDLPDSETLNQPPYDPKAYEDTFPTLSQLTTTPGGEKPKDPNAYEYPSFYSTSLSGGILISSPADPDAYENPAAQGNSLIGVLTVGAIENDDKKFIVWLAAHQWFQHNDCAKSNIHRIGFDVNPLLSAALSLRLDQIQFLISRKADIHYLLPNGKTLFQYIMHVYNTDDKYMKDENTAKAVSIFEVANKYDRIFIASHCTFVTSLSCFEESSLNFIRADAETELVLALFTLSIHFIKKNVFTYKIFEVSLKAPGLINEVSKTGSFSIAMIENLHKLILIMDQVNYDRKHWTDHVGYQGYGRDKIHEKNIIPLSKYRDYLENPIDLLQFLNQLGDESAMNTAFASTGLDRSVLKEQQFLIIKQTLNTLKLTNEALRLAMQEVEKHNMNPKKVSKVVSRIQSAQKSIYENHQQLPQPSSKNAENNLANIEREYISHRPKLATYYRALKSHLLQAFFCAQMIIDISAADRSIQSLTWLVARHLSGLKFLVSIMGLRENPDDYSIYTQQLVTLAAQTVDILRLSEEVARRATLAQENAILSIEDQCLDYRPVSESILDKMQRSIQSKEQKIIEAERYVAYFDEKDNLTPIELKGLDDSKTMLIRFLQIKIATRPNDPSEFLLNLLLGAEFISPGPAKAHLLNLIDLSQLSKNDEENLIRLFTLYPGVRAACEQYAIALQFRTIANTLFPAINTLANKMALAHAQLDFSTDEKALLMQIFSIGPETLQVDILPDLMILLTHRYQAHDLLMDTSEKNQQSTQDICRKLLETAALVERFLSREFVYNNNSTWFNGLFSDERESMINARRQAFSIFYDTPAALLDIERNSAALAARYNAHIRSKKSYKLNEHHGLTASNLAVLRDLHLIDPNESASQVGDDDLDSTCTKTTILAMRSMQRAQITAEHKKLLYHKCLTRVMKGKSEDDCALIKRLTQDIHSKLTRIFTGILSVASQFAARGDTTYTDNALDLLNALKTAIPEPITRLITSELITAAQFYLDYKELQRFLSMARNLNLFEEMDIINRELTGLVVEHYANEFLHTLHQVKQHEIETVYLQLSEKITAAVESSLLIQLAGNKSDVIAEDAMDLGVLLYEGFIKLAPGLAEKSGYIVVNGK